ncbi:MAG: homoserine dehydrogenase [Microscillaceae bacterium]|jgi:homoserine dehydrogenase|nr:homoserine dehydrogenase [Microscillaceae bacterium]
MSKQLKIGFFGFGVVGQGLYDILDKSAFPAEIIKICVKNPQKKRSIPSHHFTYDRYDILNNSEINLVIEMIDDAKEAYHIVKYALQNGKNVVTANKKMLAEHLQELVEIQHQFGTSLLYEASVCGSIPIIRNLEEYYDNEFLYSVSGIFNGSSNFILSKVFQENMPYSQALKLAQELGFAETDPTLDVGGFDAKYKLCIATAHAYGLFINPEEVFNYGIQTLSKYDLQYASEKGFKIKLVVSVGKISENEIALSVMPQFIAKDHYLYYVENEYNAVIVEAGFAARQVFVGKGAGGHPTGSAVLSDISANRYEYKYEYKKLLSNKNYQYSKNQLLEVYLRYHQESDLELFDFEDISEKYLGKDFNYVIGTISLAQLFALKDEIKLRDVFVVNTGRKVESKGESVWQESEAELLAK